MASLGSAYPMLKIILQPDDLARVRIATTVGPIAEAVFAMDLISYRGALRFGEWRRQVKDRHLARANIPGTISWPHGSGRDPGVPFEPRMRAEARAGSVTLIDPGMFNVIADFSKVAITPYWSGIKTYLQSERDARSRVLAAGGVDRLLSTLHSKIHWNDLVLSVPSDENAEVSIDGRGLLLVPSVFLHTKAAALIRSSTPAGSPVLAFSSPPDEDAMSAILGDVNNRSTQAVAALIGRTRASILHALTDGCTTTELAQMLRISASAASQHTSVLRAAGLITTRRSRNSVIHTITDLGGYLLGSKDELWRQCSNS